jgi:hypothetical protein
MLPKLIEAERKGITSRLKSWQREIEAYERLRCDPA